MVCLFCGLWANNLSQTGENPSSICRPCAHSLRPSGELRLRSGVLVRSAFLHEGAIRRAIHAFKYHGVDRSAEALAAPVAALLPPTTAALIPIPRSAIRRVRFGIDPGRVLARHVSRLSGIPVVDALRASVLHTSRLSRRADRPVRYRLAGRVPEGSVLVDDVVTTGETLNAAALVCGRSISEAVTISRSSFGLGVRHG